MLRGPCDAVHCRAHAQARNRSTPGGGAAVREGDDLVALRGSTARGGGVGRGGAWQGVRGPEKAAAHMPHKERAGTDAATGCCSAGGLQSRQWGVGVRGLLHVPRRPHLLVRRAHARLDAAVGLCFRGPGRGVRAAARGRWDAHQRSEPPAGCAASPLADSLNTPTRPKHKNKRAQSSRSGRAEAPPLSRNPPGSPQAPLSRSAFGTE